MQKMMISIVLLVLFLNGCTSNEDEKQTPKNIGAVESSYQNAIKEQLFQAKNPPKSYQAIAWEKLKSSEKVTQRIQKRVVFIEHAFKEKNNYGGGIERQNIYFIGNGKPSLMIDFDVKIAFDEFLANQAMQDLFAPFIWNFKSLHVKYQQSSTDTKAKEEIKDFIYSIDNFAKQDQDALMDTISKANTPMTIAKNVALFMCMRLFPELMEELLFGEITYKGLYY